MLLHVIKHAHQHTPKVVRTYHIGFALGGCCTHLVNSAWLDMFSRCELL